MVRSCSAYKCTNRDIRGQEPKLAFHRFPLKNPSLLKKWVEAVCKKGFKPTEYSQICAMHFIESDYLDPPGGEFRPQLKKDAIPSMYLPPKRPRKNGKNAQDDDDEQQDTVVFVEVKKLQEPNIQRVFSHPKILSEQNVNCTSISQPSVIVLPAASQWASGTQVLVQCQAVPVTNAFPPVPRPVALVPNQAALAQKSFSSMQKICFLQSNDDGIVNPVESGSLNHSAAVPMEVNMVDEEEDNRREDHTYFSKDGKLPSVENVLAVVKLKKRIKILQQSVKRKTRKIKDIGEVIRDLHNKELISAEAYSILEKSIGAEH